MVTSQQIQDDDRVWRALADRKRREILVALADEPRTTGEVVQLFPNICRTAVLKHIDILEEAGLVNSKRDGRFRWNYIDPKQVDRVCGRWIADHVARITSSAARLKALLNDVQNT